MIPMAKSCYEDLLARDPKAAGRVELRFKIVGDSDLGGIIDDAEVRTGDGGLGDEKMSMCMRESLLTLAFRAPPTDGWVTVTYPMSFSPDESPDE